MMLLRKDEPTAARRRVPLYLVDASDGLTPETSEGGGRPQVSKNGGGFADTAGTLTAVGNGAYYVELTASELDTAGVVVVRYKSAATAEAQTHCQVLAALPEDVAGAVWEQDVADHTTGGTTGEELHLAKAALVNQREHTVATGVDVIRDNDGTTALRTLTPSETGGVVTVTPS